MADTPDLKARLAPDPVLDKVFSQARELLGAEGLSNLIRNAFGSAVIDEITASAAESNERVSKLDDDARVLSEQGWVVSGIVVPFEPYQHAATLYSQGNDVEAERLLIEIWTEESRQAVVDRVATLYLNESTSRIAAARMELLTEASALHGQGRFAGAIPILLGLHFFQHLQKEEVGDLRDVCKWVRHVGFPHHFAKALKEILKRGIIHTITLRQ